MPGRHASPQIMTLALVGIDGYMGGGGHSSIDDLRFTEYGTPKREPTQCWRGPGPQMSDCQNKRKWYFFL